MTEVVSVSDLYGSICDAARRISRVVLRTRMVESPDFSSRHDCSLYLKMEHEQRTGSFKLRGAHNKMALVVERTEGKPREEITPAGPDPGKWSGRS